MTLSRNHGILRVALGKRFFNVHKSQSSPVEQALFLEKGNQNQVIALLQDEVDLIGPPDPVSNLRPVIRRRCATETKLQEQLRFMQDATHQWNQNFWATHNTKFLREKQKFIDNHQILGEEKRLLSAEEMSEFYKKFLDEHWKTHIEYNFSWYKKNFSLLFLALRVNVEKFLPRVV
ncbi:COA8 family protein CG14806, mitochondrial [Coccinella septempunctata]|uniref:COA8 family protein CG14806, mitochondrial n=1 Tax=Coccinella septempunctata TaxID=41139 RepID=UPI001D09011C|nr:COA8 family protein CG14806, mitochondrial [Coccinella septempunctata]